MGEVESTGRKDSVDQTRAPRTGVRLMIVILIGLGLVAIYANVQEVRREKIERVIVTPFSTATPAAPPQRR